MQSGRVEIEISTISGQDAASQIYAKGSVTLGSIDADIWGRVEFQNLVWLDIDGQPIVHLYFSKCGVI